MKKLRIRLTATLLASMLILTGCAENERIPVPDFPSIPDVVLPESTSSETSVSPESTYVSETVVSSTVKSASSEPINADSSSEFTSTTPVSAASESARSSISPTSAPVASSETMSTPPKSPVSVSTTHASAPPKSSAPASTTTVNAPPVSSTRESPPPSSSETPVEAPGCDEGVHKLVTDGGVVPTCKRAGVSCGVHCEACGDIISRQDKLSKVHDFRVSDITRPANGADGTVSYACTGCGYPFECAYKANLTERNVYNTLIAMRSAYPEGAPYDNSTKYVTKDLFPNVEFTGRGCAGFAAALSDKAFGDLPGRYHFDFSKIRVGDIVRMQNNTHSVIVLKVEGNVITAAEGNYNSSVHWGRTLDLSDASVGWTYVLTRYPE